MSFPQNVDKVSVAAGRLVYLLARAVDARKDSISRRTSMVYEGTTTESRIKE